MLCYGVNSMKEEYENFIKNINWAEKILDISELRENLTQFYKWRKTIIEEGNVPILQKLRQIRVIPRIRDLVDQTIEIASPLLLVFSVSCLEHFLSTVVTADNLSKMIDACKPKVGEELTRKVHEIRIKRNIIIHSPGHQIRSRHLKDFARCRILGYQIGQQIELTPEDVKEDLKTLREFVEKIAFSQT